MARRGRTIGSGLDDTAMLNLISDEMSKDPTIPVLTAIRRIGIRNEPSIRRLLEKFEDGVDCHG